MLAGHEAGDCVVDASVGIKLFLREPLSDAAHVLFTHLAEDPTARFFVPDLFFVECANILWKYVRRFGYPAADAKQAIADLVTLPLEQVPTAALVEDALALALETGCTAYDGVYAALARRLALPLITADEALVRRFAGTGIDVRVLSPGA